MARSGSTTGVPWPAVATLPVVALLMLAAFWLQVSGPFNHDVAFTLVGARTLLGGGEFGVDVIDPNPPLAWWLAMGPMAFSRLASIRPEWAAIGFTLALATLSLAVAARHVRGATIVWAAILLLFAPGYDFGQREHWMAILALPWLVAAALCLEGKRVDRSFAIAAGGAAGLAFCLKPYFLLVPLAVECWVMARARQWRMLFRLENLVMGAMGLAYAAAILVFSPGYLRQVIPDAISVYWAFDQPGNAIFLKLGFNLLLLGLGSGLLIREAGRMPPLAQALMLAAVGSAAAVLLQDKDWNYHWLPVRIFAGLGGMVLLQAALRSRDRALLCCIAFLPILYVTFFGAINGMAKRSATQVQTDRLAGRLLDESDRAGLSVFAFVTSPRDVFPAILAADARWVSAACCVQWVPADVRADERPGDAARTRTVVHERFSAVLRELEHTRPKLLLIDDRPRKLGFGSARFDYLPYLMRNPRFVAFFARYEEAAPVAGYRVFVRRKAAQAAGVTRS